MKKFNSIRNLENIEWKVVEFPFFFYYLRKKNLFTQVIKFKRLNKKGNIKTSSF